MTALPKDCRSTVLIAAVAILAASPLGRAARADEGGHGSPVTIRLSPSGGDDAGAFDDAIACARASTVPVTIELAHGTFRISRSIVARGFSGTIRGAGKSRTTIVADASLDPSGIYPNIPATVAEELQLPTVFPFIFLFAVDERRFASVSLADLTLATAGRTALHSDPNVETPDGSLGQSDRLFSHVWVVGHDAGWKNQAGLTPPAAPGGMDADHRQLSTFRFRCRNVVFDGTNRTAGAPDVRNAFGIEGGFVFPEWIFKPINASLSFIDCDFKTIPGQSGIFAPAVIGRDDTGWTYPSGAVAGEITVRGCTFEDVLLGLLTGETSATRIEFVESRVKRSEVAVNVWGAYAAHFYGPWFGYPPTQPSELIVEGSRFEDHRFAGVLVDEPDGALGPPTLEARIRDCRFRQAGEGQNGIFAFAARHTTIRDCQFDGIANTGILAVLASGLEIVKNDFCDLDAVRAAIVLENTTSSVVARNDCATVIEGPPHPSNHIQDGGGGHGGD